MYVTHFPLFDIAWDKSYSNSSNVKASEFLTGRERVVEAALVAVVDDDDAVRDSIGTLLEAHGYDVLYFESAIDFLENGVPSMLACLVLDFHMPLMTGIDLLRELRSRGISYPTILVTGHYDAVLRERALEEGASEVLQKPPADNVLVAAIERAVQAAENAA